MEIKKLLFVTTFEDIGFDALLSLMELRNAALEHVVFLKVIERKKMAVPLGENQEIRLREMANIRFTDWAEELFRQRLEVSVHIVVGSPVQQILSAVADEAVDLIVVGLQEKGKMAQRFSGASVSEIIRTTRTPVLVYKYRREGGQALLKPFERPLLVADGSPASRSAATLLKGLTGVVQEIHVVHIAAGSQLKETSAMKIQETRKTSLLELDAICAEFEAGGMPARPHLYVGKARVEIEKAARELKATLIVMGASPQKGWQEKIWGSAQKALSIKSAFPVLIVPALKPENL